MLEKITTGKQQRAVKTVIYGIEGIGKSTLASKFPDPLFLDTEGGTGNMDVKRVEINSWPDLLTTMDEIIKAKKAPCKTVVIDTIDKAEDYCKVTVCQRNHMDGIEKFGYGKGYVYLAEEFNKALDLSDRLIEKGYNVTFIGHSQINKFELPEELGQFDKYELNLHKKTAPLLKKWADMLLFCNYSTVVKKTDTGKNKASGNVRKLYTAHDPTFEAKNRYGLPIEGPLSWDFIRGVFDGTLTEEPVQGEEEPEEPTETPTPAKAVRPAVEPVQAADEDLPFPPEKETPQPKASQTGPLAELLRFLAENKIDVEDFQELITRRANNKKAVEGRTVNQYPIEVITWALKQKQYILETLKGEEE